MKRIFSFLAHCLGVLCLFMATPPPAAAQVQYGFMGNPTLTAEAGAENLIALHRIAYGLEDRFLKAKWFEEDKVHTKLASVTYRLARTVLLDHPIDHIAYLVQHEVFGHGARYRELGLQQDGYHITLPPPYGPGHGWASWSGDWPSDQYAPILTDLGGVDGAAVLGTGLRDRAVLRGRSHYREALLYIIAHNNLPGYILGTDAQTASPGNDIMNYLTQLDVIRGNTVGWNWGRALTLEGLKRRALVSFLDPYHWIALYTVAVRYVWQGETSLSLPKIKAWETTFLPSIRLGLTPFGSEYILENLMARDGRFLNVYGRFGDGPMRSSWGAGVHAQLPIIQDRLTSGIQLDLWQQPFIILDRQTGIQSARSTGWGIQIPLSYRLTDKLLGLQVTGEVGYKTRGFVPGEMLSGGFQGMIGLSILEGYFLHH